MRINQYVALATGKSRRAADALIKAGQITVNNSSATPGQSIKTADEVRLNDQLLTLQSYTTVMLHKPVGYVCSRRGQGSRTIYDLLPSNYHRLKPIGRLDKDSSGLILLTNDGPLAQQLTHPSHNKQKVYQVSLDKPLTTIDSTAIEQGIKLDDGLSRLKLKGSGQNWVVTISQGRNRQIRRTFGAVGYGVTGLHRTQFGPYNLDSLAQGMFKPV